MKVSLNDFKVVKEFPVHWGDMDAAQHVNNLIYLRWTESGRVGYFEAMNMTHSFAEVGMILGWHDCKYIFPMTYPDTAIVGVRVSQLLDDRVILETAIFSKQHQRIAALSKQHIIPYDYKQLKKVPVPSSWKDAITNI